MKTTRALALFAVGGALIASLTTFGVSTASAAPPSTPGPQIHGSKNCPGNLKTVVPDSGDVAKRGIKAVGAALGADGDGLEASPALDKILKGNPHWVSEIQCGDRLPLRDPHVTETGTMTPAAASGTTNITNATSYNWTGYRLKGTDPNHIYYTSVAGNWSVPYFDPPNNSVQESASQWVGIGSGDTGWDQLIQAGTVAYTGPGWNGIGPSGTYGFYESYPLQSEVIIQNLPVNSGDVAGASVSYIARSNTMIWVVCSSSANNTCVSGTEALGSTVGTYAEQAEWIMERHSVNGLNTLLLPFVRADYYGATYKEWRGGSTVSDTYILNQGPTGPGLTLDNIAMVDCGGTPTLASTGSLDSQGNFSTFSYHQGTAC